MAGAPSQEGRKQEDRAKIRAEFEAVKPEIRGIIYEEVDVLTPLKLGLGLLGRPVVVDAPIPVPTPSGIVTLKLKDAKADENRSFREGDPLLGPAGPLFVKRILRDSVCFEYKGEEIWVSTARP